MASEAVSLSERRTSALLAKAKEFFGKPVTIVFKDKTRLFHSLKPHSIIHIDEHNPPWIETEAEGVHTGFYLNEVEGIKGVTS